MDTAAQLLVTAGDNRERLREQSSFAALRGVAPVPASSGKTTRHRLSRSSHRGANNALHRIPLVRMPKDAPAQAYAARQTQTGRSKPEIMRLLKCAIVREIYRLLTRAVPISGQSASSATSLSRPPQDIWASGPALCPGSNVVKPSPTPAGHGSLRLDNNRSISTAFIADLRGQMTAALGKPDTGWRPARRARCGSPPRRAEPWTPVPKLEKLPEPANLDTINAEGGRRWGTIDLQNMLEEADYSPPSARQWTQARSSPAIPPAATDASVVRQPCETSFESESPAGWQV